jgi:hypothetical protein
MNVLDHVHVVQPTVSSSQKEAMTCPTCKKPKDWSGDKPGSAKAPASKFRAMSVKRGRGRPRVRPADKRKVIFY